MSQVINDKALQGFPKQLIRSKLQEFAPYSAAKPRNFETKVKLNANESPFALSIESFDEINRYPQAQTIDKIRSLLAPYLEVREEQIFLSRGSGEGIDMLCRIFYEANEDAVMVSSPSFSLYENYARIQGAQVSTYQTDESNGFYICPQKLLEQMLPRTKIIFLCSPNNPTGQSISEEDLLVILDGTKGRSMVLVDEAYVEFSDQGSFSRLLNDYPNLIVLRTFSKAWSLAGLRMGCILGHPQLIAFLNKIKAPYAFSSPSLETFAGYLTQDCRGKLEHFVSHIKEARAKLSEELKALGVIKQVFPSDANFIMCKVDDAQKIKAYLGAKGILVRVVGEAYLRLTIGSEEENTMLTKALASF
ncbi:MAG: histidinol-phosphate transaminase [Oligoflexales bacterium]|nr:histidinol-phosphate transaminase [Oligoflexales bacterium]